MYIPECARRRNQRHRLKAAPIITKIVVLCTILTHKDSQVIVTRIPRLVFRDSMVYHFSRIPQHFRPDTCAPEITAPMFDTPLDRISDMTSNVLPFVKASRCFVPSRSLARLR